MTIAGIDLGTTTVCGLLLDAESGDILSVVTEPNTASITGGRSDESLQDPETIVAIAGRIIGGFLDARPDLRGIGIAAQMHGILYVDAAGRALGPLATWQDGRGDRKTKTGETWVQKLSRDLGRRVATGMGFVTHAVNVAESGVPAGAASLCTIADYVAMRLCGETRPVMDPTMAASLGCFDLEALDFRRDIIDRLGLDPALFPRVARDYPAVGTMRGVPVFAGMGDNQAGFLGSVRSLAGSLVVNVGTSSQISAFTPRLAEVAGIDTRPFPFGGFILVGAGLCGGRSYALVRDFFARTMRLFGSDPGLVTWDALNAVDGSSLTETGRAVMDTRFSGSRTDPEARGSITNLSASTFTPEQLIVAVREGIVAELRGFFDLFPDDLRPGVRALFGSGNAIRNNPALRAVFETRFGLPMRVPAHREEASFGAALLAGVASGIFPDRADAGEMIRYE
jgi:sedoheptulokinase